MRFDFIYGGVIITYPNKLLSTSPPARAERGVVVVGSEPAARSSIIIYTCSGPRRTGRGGKNNEKNKQGGPAPRWAASRERTGRTETEVNAPRKDYMTCTSSAGGVGGKRARQTISHANVDIIYTAVGHPRIRSSECDWRRSYTGRKYDGRRPRKRPL